MSFACVRSFAYTFVMVIVIIFVLQIRSSCEGSRVSGTRTMFLGENLVGEGHRVMTIDKKTKEELLHKYFHGRTFGFASGDGSSSTDSGVFDEAKRTVPSCPDPLHN